MKIRKYKSKQILFLYLLKFKMYEHVLLKKTSNVLTKSSLIELLTSFKKALQVIFLYHIKGKQIVFIGLPEQLSLKINKQTPYSAVSKYCNIQGNLLTVTKNKHIFSSLKTISLKRKKNKKVQLIVLVDHVNAEMVFKESDLAKIPLISVNIKFNKKCFFSTNTYSVGLYQNLFQPLYNFFFLSLSFLLK